MGKRYNKNNKALRPIETTALATQPVPQSMPEIISHMLNKLDGPGIKDAADAIVKLANLQKEFDALSAEREFNQSLVEFQINCPLIKKTSKADVVTKAGGQYGYTYAKLDEIAKTIREPLHQFGFSYTWDSKTEGNIITTTCHLRHRGGHKITANATAPIPSELMKMNQIQIPSATRTYLERQSLVQVLGLSTTDEDTDGADPTPIDETQIGILKGLIQKVGGDSETGLCNYIGVEKLEDIRQTDYQKAFIALNKKLKAKGGPVPTGPDSPATADQYTILSKLIEKIDKKKDSLEIGDEYIDKKQSEIQAGLTIDQADKMIRSLKDILGE